MADIFVCGDIVNISEPSRFISEDLFSIIEKADYSIANLEGPELKVGQLFDGPHQSAGTLKYLSECFNMMLLANNHIAELGDEGLRYTTQLIDKYGMDRIGAGFTWEEAHNTISRNISGLRFAFVNVGEAQEGYYVDHQQEYGYAWMGNCELLGTIHRLSQSHDYVVVFVHAGLEHFSVPLPEIRMFYKSLCDAGASAIIGSHPHSAQGYEYYNGSLIAYSLGNFFFPRKNNPWPEEDSSYSLLLSFNEDGEISVEPIIHRLKKCIVSLEKGKDQQIDIASLCHNLENNYYTLSNRMCIEVYHKLCRKMLVESLCGENENASFIDILKGLLKRSIFRNRFIVNTKKCRDKQLLRVLENESYRYAITRALQIITKDGKN